MTLFLIIIFFRYPYLVRMYQNLRKDNFPFKPHFDASRILIATAPATASRRPSADGRRPSLEGSSAAAVRRDSASRPSIAVDTSEVNTYIQRRSSSTGTSSDMISNLEVIQNLGTILRDMICASSSERELKENDAAAEMVSTLQGTQAKIAVAMEGYMEQHPEDIERVFRLNELVTKSSILLSIIV
jgi:hypothetical protein